MSSIYTYIDAQIHQFSAGDKSHPQTTEIYTKLDDMIRRLRLTGYVPITSAQVLFGCSGKDDCTEDLEDVEQVFFTHSEKLALCLGLLRTKSGSPLYIFKNLGICQDCHSAIVSIVSRMDLVPVLTIGDLSINQTKKRGWKVQYIVLKK
ncbi:hypothetical protein L6164_006779 [Bauhinia variegata]|uniref:Uncharacterized protein n=1 Tax=Bauhinia variegata TaxID=167791 RepID=A0ACB9PUX1_BAUVA|nr:hypothetical protein L6164_006779 [Bauhinia variegata]